MKNVKNLKNFVGIDLGKKNMEIIRIDRNDKKMRLNLKTDAQGVMRLSKWLNAEDLVALEAGNLAFRIARLIKPLCKKVVVLNPGDLATIYASMKKTDKEDALKLARLVMRIPVEELPTVSIPSLKEEQLRRLSSEYLYQRKLNTSLINRLHSLYLNAGITQLLKKDLKTEEMREQSLKQLPKAYLLEAKRLHHQINTQQKILKEIDEQVGAELNEHINLSKVYMSMPGIGPINTLVLVAYLGNGQRFSHPKQVAYYSGLVPRVDISGDTARYGHITKRGCVQIRSVLIQAAWSLVRSKQGGLLKAKYESLYKRIGKGKAIVAIARKMLEALYVMVKENRTYKFMDDKTLRKKLISYGLFSLQGA